MSHAQMVVNGDIGVTYALPEPPVIPGLVGGVLDVAGLDFIFVKIPFYTNYSPCDRLTLHMGELSIPVPSAQKMPSAGGFVEVKVPVAGLANGRCFVSFTAEDLAGNAIESIDYRIDIVNGPGGHLKSPYFPEYPNARASRADILRAGGALVAISTENLRVGDLVTMSWTGFFESRSVAVESLRTLVHRSITAADVAGGRIEVWLELSAILATGPYGQGVAHYEVLRDAGGQGVLTLVSGPGALGLVEEGDFLLLGATSGAVVSSLRQTYVVPANRLWLGSSPYSEVVVSADNGAVFVGSDSASRVTVNTGVTGLVALDLSCGTTGHNDTACTISAQLLGSENAVSVKTTSVFVAGLLASEDGAFAYAARDFALADGIDLCEIYLSAPQLMPTVPVTAAGGALVCGYASSHLYMVNDDQSLTVSISSMVEGKMAVKIGNDDHNFQYLVDFRKSPF